MSKQFDVPVVLIIFKRPDKSVQIMSRIAQVKPRKMYIISDGGRTEMENQIVLQCRQAVEKAVTWECAVVKDYAAENKGVFDRIGLGALRVFEQEKCAIFLEDDNLPQISFFYYCKELLSKYEENPDVMWICGTNYLGSCHFSSGADYGFTKNLLPCGWASWGEKFRAYYSRDFSLYSPERVHLLRKSYVSRRLYVHDIRAWKQEVSRKAQKGRFISWDYHMSFSLRVHDKLGIIPRNNQIKNIGVDDLSAHGGRTFDNVMIQRLCGMDSYPLIFPLKHPGKVEVDQQIEKRLERIITEPVSILVAAKSAKLLRFVFKIPQNQRIRTYFGKQRWQNFERKK